MTLHPKGKPYTYLPTGKKVFIDFHYFDNLYFVRTADGRENYLASHDELRPEKFHNVTVNEFRDYSFVEKSEADSFAAMWSDTKCI